MRRIVIAALASLLLAGCEIDRHVADELVTFNEAQQKGNSQLLLLNILRAREKQPLAFSRFDVLRGGISANSSLGLAVPFGAGSPANSSIATGLGLSPGISQDIRPQEDQDFYRGILTPVSEETWALYQDQNWSPDLLFHLFVEDIKLTKLDFATVVRSTNHICEEHEDVQDIAVQCAAFKDGKAQIDGMTNCKLLTHLIGGRELVELTNDPGDSCRLLEFETFTEALLILGFHITQQTTKTDIGPPLQAGAFNDLKWPFALKGSNVELASAGKSFQFQHVSSDYAVSLSNLPCPERTNVAVAATSELAPQTDAAATQAADTPGCEHRAKLDIAITTRSPDGMIYYMGEVARALMPMHPDQAPHPVMVRSASGKRRALLALVAGDDGNAAARVRYRGATYSVPHGDDHVTMQAFELLQQVFALYNRASTTPTTTAVTVVP